MKLKLGNYNIEMIHHDPTIFTVEGILRDDECLHFRDIASKNMKRSLVSGFDKTENSSFENIFDYQK